MSAWACCTDTPRFTLPRDEVVVGKLPKIRHILSDAGFVREFPNLSAQITRRLLFAPPTDTGPLVVESRTVALEPFSCRTRWLPVASVCASRQASRPQLRGEWPAVSMRTPDRNVPGKAPPNGPLTGGGSHLRPR